ncbi:bifunctional 2',3'-cyclic-nucleotide 2'-phosphodiesterase/3'-nucleotidase [Halovulum marinum]|uniref:bifunctional 2',3'-cyclic-nucleotide 2'-phosphodiesterase/3'-nucleotidase n=1 Tax=Halovulum marinum TaxID=2662447 RepID=UPI001F399247|nr:bifunctional 2',3'-cyclic-nucleotide 2'-phosphodiesterase/3'-nucleotidase [Halovulum marinum]
MTTEYPPCARIMLRVLATTDLHMQVRGWDYTADRAAPGMGLARLASLIGAARAESPNSLTVDCGDHLQGNPMGDLFAGGPGPHPMFAAMAAAGIEVTTLGNHDFNYGVEALENALETAPFPVVCANVARGALAAGAQDDPLLLPAWTILDRRVTDAEGRAHALRIGLIGLCPPQILNWDARLLAGRVGARDMIDAAAAHVPRLRAAGADIVIALSHSGIQPGPRRPLQEQASLQLGRVPGIDAIVAGHQHRLFPGPEFAPGGGIDPRAGTLHGVPAVMPGFWGTHLGVLDLALQRGPQGWRVDGHTSALRPVAERGADGALVPLVPESPAVLRATAAAHARTLTHIHEPIGRVTAPVTSHFALVADDPAVQLVARAQAWAVARALRGSAQAELPLVSITSPFKAGGRAGPDHYHDIAAGPLRLRDAADLYLFPNAACALLLNGAQLADWLERSASLFRQAVPGARDVPLLAPGVATYNFDIAHGLRYAIDLSQPARFDADGQRVAPAASRIRGLCHRGRPVAPDDRFVVASNSYRVGGGGDFPIPADAPRLLETEETNRDMLVRWIRAQPAVDPTPAPGWDFTPVAGASVVFDSAPEADPATAPRRRIERAGAAPGGFARFRLHL